MFEWDLNLKDKMDFSVPKTIVHRVVWKLACSKRPKIRKEGKL